MSLERDGFVRKDPLQRIEEIKDLIKLYIPGVDLSEAEILYQIIKVAAMREDGMQNVIQELVDNMSFATSYGEYARAWAAAVGAFPSYGVKATGNIIATMTVPLATVTLPELTVFSTEGGVEFATTEEMDFPFSIPVTRGSGSTDTINVIYQVDSIEWINSTGDGTGTTYTGYTLSDGVITWDGTAGNPLTGVQYFVRPTDGTINAVIAARAVLFGTDGNIGANTALTCASNPLVTAIVGPDGIAGGSGIEADEVVKARGLNAKFRNRTSEALKTLLENVDGVDEIAIQEVQGTDVAIPSTWDTSAEPSGIAVPVSMVTTAFLKQKFSPSSGVASNRSVDFRISRPTANYVGSLSFHLFDANQDELDNYTITTDDLDYSKGTSLQTVNVPLRTAPLYSTNEYYVGVSQTATPWGVQVKANDTPGAGLLTNDTDFDMVYRTRYLANYYNVQVLPIDGYDFTTVSADIETVISDEGEGFSIFGVDHNITEINTNAIKVEATIYTKKGYTWVDVSSEISNAVGNYIDGLSIGENVLYLGVIGAIMGVAGVLNVGNVTIYKDSVASSTSTTMLAIHIADDYKAIADTPVVNLTHGNP